MYQLKNAAKCVAAFTAAVGMMAGITSTAFPVLVFADALNPLTERSLMLSSSSPGWLFTDGSGNPTYAGPGTGPNGKKTGETFSFKVSTDSVATSRPIKGFTFHYCTAPAGECTPPGDTDVVQTPADKDNDQESNLNVHYTSPVEGTDFSVRVAAADDVGTVGVDESADYSLSTANTGWSMTASRQADNPSEGGGITENNFITLFRTTNDAGYSPTSGQKMFIRFFANDTNYITNPGSGAFFVKINDYDSNDPDDMYTQEESEEDDPVYEPHIIDGGVTVANVMNESIWITTKVLETMAFSVGTENPDTVTLPDGFSHGACDPITVNQQIALGDQNAEFSLSPNEAFEANSYWRLSTNSSGGAIVYYSGATLWNTVGDKIPGIGASSDPSHPGTEQFGLALDLRPETVDTLHDAVVPTLNPLVAETNYAVGGGVDDGNSSDPDGQINATSYVKNDALFAFDEGSLTSPVSIAKYYADVINCSTGKMRYVANIAPATPAGVYTTKVNYIAAPQY